MIRRPPRTTRTNTLFPYTTLLRSWNCHLFPCQSPVAARKGRSCRVGSSQPVYRLGSDAGVGNGATRAAGLDRRAGGCRYALRSEEHTSELQSLMRISYAVFCLKKKKLHLNNTDYI